MPLFRLVSCGRLVLLRNVECLRRVVCFARLVLLRNV